MQVCFFDSRPAGESDGLILLNLCTHMEYLSECELQVMKLFGEEEEEKGKGRERGVRGKGEKRKRKEG